MTTSPDNMPLTKEILQPFSERGEEETQGAAPGAEPQLLLHGRQMPRML